MDNKDSKIRLFLEFCHTKPIQILDVYPLFNESEWTPKQMYDSPSNQSIYVWITDRTLLDELQTPRSPEDDIDRIKTYDQIRIEFNVNSIDEPNQNPDDEKEIVLAKVNIENAKCIYDYNKLDKKKLKDDYSIPVFYALKGRIKTLLYDEQEFNDPKSDMNIGSVSKDGNKNSDDGKGEGDTPSPNTPKPSTVHGIDGHWFLLNGTSRLQLISLIRYRELTTNKDGENEQSNNTGNKPGNFTTGSNGPGGPPISMSNYYQPMQYAIYIKENNKLVSLYQSKSCRFHSKKNEFYCKTCNDFCCLECFDESDPIRSHKNHKIKLLDEVLAKIEEDSKALDERVLSLKNIIGDEMAAKRAELVKIKTKNSEVVKKITELNDKKKLMIKNEEIRRAKVLAALGTEVLRIINDFHQKEKYLKLLAAKGDMATYLSNYFIFKKYFENDVKKNFAILEKKILEVYSKFVESNQNWQNMLSSMKQN